jgi:tetratricopeptide (TPR) repeat protein
MVCRIALWAALALGIAVDASGQAQYENISRCESNEPDVAIGGCTALIRSGLDTTYLLVRIYYNRGNAYRDKGQYDRAIQDYDEAIRLDPKYADAFNNRGYTYNAKGQYDRAIKDFDEAIRLNPHLVAAFVNRGYSYDFEGQRDRALQDFDVAIRLDPEDKAAVNDRGYVYAAKGQYDRAFQDYDEAIRLDPKYKTALKNRGYVYAAKGQYDRAIQDYDEAIRLDPNYASAIFDRGRANFYRLDFPSAVTDLQHYNELKPSDAYAILWLHLAKKHLGQDDNQDLKRRAAKIDLSKWPAPIVQMYMRQVKAKQVFAAAASPDAEKQKNQLCEVDFYTGEDALLHQHWFFPWKRANGIARLRSAKDSCPIDYIESVGAIVELKRIRNTIAPVY